MITNLLRRQKPSGGAEVFKFTFYKYDYESLENKTKNCGGGGIKNCS